MAAPDEPCWTPPKPYDDPPAGMRSNFDNLPMCPPRFPAEALDRLPKAYAAALPDGGTFVRSSPLPFDAGDAAR